MSRLHRVLACLCVVILSLCACQRRHDKSPTQNPPRQSAQRATIQTAPAHDMTVEADLSRASVAADMPIDMAVEEDPELSCLGPFALSCHSHGECTYEPTTKQCVTTDESCALTKMCREEGKCASSAAGDACVAKSARLCERSEGCRREGMCALGDGGSCVVPKEGCAKTRACIERGECELDEKLGTCGPGVGQRVNVCHTRGECVFAEGELMPTSEKHCLESWECAHSGMCKYEKVNGRGRCVRGTAAQCEASIICRDSDRCTPSLVWYLGCVTEEELARQKLELELKRDPCSRSASDHFFCTYAKTSPACMTDPDTKACGRALVTPYSDAIQCSEQGVCLVPERAELDVLSYEGCAQTKACKEEGRCAFSYSQKACVEEPMTREQKQAFCAMSLRCINFGECVFDEGEHRCIAPNSRFCEESRRCDKKSEGCTLGTSNQCEGAQRTSCQDDPLGRTVFDPVYQRCVATDASCAAHPRCQSEGRCAAIDVEGDTFCVATDAICAAREACKTSGFCRADPFTGACEDHYDAICRQRPECERDGKCAVDLETTTTIDAQYENFYDSDAPYNGGLLQVPVSIEPDAIVCKVGEAKPVTLSAECEANGSCKKSGACFALEGECVTQAQVDASWKEASDPWTGELLAESKQATHWALIAGYWRKKPSFRCKKSSACVDDAQCTGISEEVCVSGVGCSDKFIECQLASAADCKRSNLCKQDNLCDMDYFWVGKGSPEEPGCAVTPAFCKKSEGCKQYGACDRPGTWECHPSRDAHCARSVQCKTLGNCAIVPLSGYHECAPTSAAHCEASTGCKEEGRCTYDGATCTR